MAMKVVEDPMTLTRDRRSALLSAALIVFVTSAGLFDVPLALGAPRGIRFMPTEIYAMVQSPSDLGRAAALFVDWQSCSDSGEELVDPIHGQRAKLVMADDVGEKAYNQKLSTARADAVKT